VPEIKLFRDRQPAVIARLRSEEAGRGDGLLKTKTTFIRKPMVRYATAKAEEFELVESVEANHST